MTKWVCQAVLDSLTVFFLPMAAYKDATTVWAERGYSDGIYVFGTTVYAGLILAMMMKVFNMTNVSLKKSLPTCLPARLCFDVFPCCFC